MALREAGPAEALVLLRRENEPDARTQPSVASPAEDADDEPEADEPGDDPRSSACWTCWWSAAAEADDVADGLPFFLRVVLLVRDAGSAGRAAATVAFRELEPEAATAAGVLVLVGGRKLLPEPALDDSALRNWPEDELEDEPDEPVGDETGNGRRRRPNASDDGPGDGTGRAADVARDEADPVVEVVIEVASERTLAGGSRWSTLGGDGGRWMEGALGLALGPVFCAGRATGTVGRCQRQR